MSASKTPKQSNLPDYVYHYPCELPENLRLELLLSRTDLIGAPMKDKSKLRDVMMIYIDMYVKQSRSKKEWNKVGKKEMTVHSNIMKRINNKYQWFLRFLLENGILELVKEFRKGVHSNVYKFTDKYVGRRTFKHAVLDDALVIKRLRSISPSAKKKHPKLLKSLFTVSVDWSIAEKIAQHLMKIPKTEETKPLNENTWMNTQHQLLRIEREDLAKFKLGKTGRLFHLPGMVKSEFRAAFICNGQPLAGYDLKSSIPFLSSVLFDLNKIERLPIIKEIVRVSKIVQKSDSLNQINSLLSLVEETREDPTEKFRELIALLSPLLLLVKISTLTHKPKDVLTYIEQSQIDLYEYLRADWNRQAEEKGLPPMPSERKKFKKRVMAIMNGGIGVENMPEMTYFQNTFPNVHKAFRELQEGYIDKRLRKITDPRMENPFATVTQKFEAHIILAVVCGELFRIKPDIVLITLHDSILTTVDNLELLEHVMRTKIKEIVGYEPRLKLDSNLPVYGPGGKSEQSKDLPGEAAIQESLKARQVAQASF